MKKTLIATFVAVSALSVAGIASAAVNTSGFSGKGSGFYAGVNVGYAHGAWKSPNSIVTVKDKSGLTYGLNAGYMFNTNLGVELGYDMYSKVEVDASTGSIEYADIKNQDALSIMGVANFPVAPMWNVFAKLGMTRLSGKVSSVIPNVVAGAPDSLNYKVWAPTIAAGASYDVMPNMSVNSQLRYIMEQKNLVTDLGQFTPNYTALTVGVNYKF